MVSMEQKTHNTIIHEHVGALLHTQIDNCTITHVAACMAGLSVIATSGRATGQVSHVVEDPEREFASILNFN